ncbi:MAG: protease inhibitor I42 family protein [Bacteroidota bacterium]
MNNTFFYRFVLFLVITLFAACRPQVITEEAPIVNEVRAGEKFRINLPEDHSTGYGWQLNPDFDNTVVQHLNAVWHGKEKGIDFNFKALSVGQVTFTLINRKYTDTSGTRFFVVKIIPN